ncbi:MAG: MlrC C-terminal domain-containing protein, partial [Symbiobacteriaceae bacterium]|nr:MlrC C-terminal domain-containing protein [Symbiobacteriaceae bacterium]
EAVAAAIASGEHPVVINEASDNPGGGAPADGTHLLRELIRVNHPRTIFGFLFDPETVEQAHKAGVGAVINTRIGGKTDTIHGETLELEGVLVCALSNGEVNRRTAVGDGVPFRMGRAARLKYRNVEIIIGSLAIQTRDDRPFLAVGADYRQYDLVAMKSTNHFRAFYEKNAKGIFTADPPGIHTANFSILPYKNLPRPIYPIDDMPSRK